jgi:hypothetical protein
VPSRQAAVEEGIPQNVIGEAKAYATGTWHTLRGAYVWTAPSRFPPHPFVAMQPRWVAMQPRWAAEDIKLALEWHNLHGHLIRRYVEQQESAERTALVQREGARQARHAASSMADEGCGKGGQMALRSIP